jgi:hypothetical protein
MEGWDSILGVAEVCNNEYIFDINLTHGYDFFDHTRKVDWIKDYKYGEQPKLERKIGFYNTLSRVKPKQKRWNSLLNAEF